MLQNTIQKIKIKILEQGSLDSIKKTELLLLLDKLNYEINELSKTKTEHAENIAGLIEHSTIVVMQQEKDPDLIRKALDGLSDSVKGFEVSHPNLVENVNYIASVLAKMGL